jgi:hypothetical protein
MSTCTLYQPACSVAATAADFSSLPVCHVAATKRRPVIAFVSCDTVSGTSEPLDRGVDNMSTVLIARDVGDKRENPRFAAALPGFLYDGLNLGALARRSRDDG